MKIKITLAFSSFLLCSCLPSPKDSTCIVTPPATNTAEGKSAQKVAADLSAFAKLPIKFNFENALSNKFDMTFQKVNDAHVRCQMLVQLAACYQDDPDAQSQVIKLISERRVCDG